RRGSIGGIPILGESARVKAPYLVAKITKTPEGIYALDGWVTGRIAFTDLVGFTARTETDELGVRKPLCQAQYWPAIPSVLCQARDIMEDPSRDGLGDPCDAITTAIGFSALEARVAGPPHAPPDRVVECEASVTCD